MRIQRSVLSMQNILSILALNAAIIGAAYAQDTNANYDPAQALFKLGENTRNYPKIGVNLCGVRWTNVENCIRQVKEEKLGNTVAFFGVERGRNMENMTDQERSQVFKNWAILCQKEKIFYYGIFNNMMFPHMETNLDIASEYYFGGMRGEYDCKAYSILGGKVHNMQEARDAYVEWMRKDIAFLKRNNIPVMCEEAGPLGHGEGLEAGMDIMFSEAVTFPGLTMASARGAAKAYEKPLWGAWLNVEYYAGGGYGGYGPPKDDAYTPAHQRRLMLEYNLAYIYGADLIFLQDCLFKITIAGYFEPNVKPRYGMDSVQCRGFREKAKAFYQYAQSHPRSERPPDVDIGLVWGNLEGMPTRHDLLWMCPSRDKIWRNWKPTIERGWYNLVDIDLIALSCPLINDFAPYANIKHKGRFPEFRGKYYRYTGTPYGQFDIVPVRAPLDVLQKYKTLMFLGWNTMTPEIYGKLREYVNAGGHLFMSLPQLSQQIERKPELELINKGDFKDLFGVSVKGKYERKAGEKPENVVEFKQASSAEQYKFPAGGTFECDTNYPALEYADLKLEGARVLAATKNGNRPVLLENRLGKGLAFLLATYSFTPAPAAVVKPVVAGTVKAGAVELPGEMEVKKDINYAVYPGKTEQDETKILLVNIDWTTADNVKNVKLRIKDMILPVEVKEGAIKTVNVLDGLVLTVGNESACLTLAKSSENKYTAKLSGQGECAIKGYVRGNGPKSITLDGKEKPFAYNPDTHLLEIKCNLNGGHVLDIALDPSR